jgi:hypothetical protein
MNFIKNILNKFRKPIVIQTPETSTINESNVVPFGLAFDGYDSVDAWMCLSQEEKNKEIQKQIDECNNLIKLNTYAPKTQ